MQLSLANVINISVATPQQGAGQYNTANVAHFTAEAYADSFGDDGYKIYLEPTEVGTDFGTDSNTYKMALALFSQQPNILLNGGYLVVIPFVTSVQTVTWSNTANGGSFTLNWSGHSVAGINYNSSTGSVQTAMRAIPGYEHVEVTGSFATAFSIAFKGVYNQALVTISSNTMVNGVTALTPTITEPTVGETFAAAITRTVGLVQYFGIMTDASLSDVEMTDAAAVVQPLIKLLMLVSTNSSDVEPSGVFDDIRTGSYTHTRCLFYGDAQIDALRFMAAYAGLGFSTVFSGSNTTQTMHLKTLSGISPDSTMTQTLLQKCQDAGADVYVSLQGISKVFCSGANDFFDNVFNLQWLVGALQVAGFNALAQTNTKVPQTENGMNILKSAYRAVMEQAVTNQFLAPGSWTSPTTFGNQADLYLNIEQRGYYIYSAPISQQLPTDREGRIAPLVQIAAKYAGAIHKSSVIVYVNP